MDSITLTERCQDWNQNLSVDEDNRLVKNVALSGGASRNGYTYSESALQEAVHLYEGKPVFLDHARDRSRPQDRSTRDLVGSVTHAIFSEGRIRGDIQVLDTESGQMFLKLLEMETPGVGMSHVVKARRSADGKLVEQIADVISVDVVVNPATTSTFRESVDAETGASKEHAEALHCLDEQVTQLESERDQLLSENLKLKTCVESFQRKDQIAELISESNLPDQVVTDFFVKQLESASDHKTRRQMIQDRLHIVSVNGERQPAVQSQERTPLSESTQNDDHFVQAIRRK